MFSFKPKKEKKPDSKDLIPRGVKYSIIPQEYLDRFPANDLHLYTNKKEII